MTITTRVPRFLPFLTWGVAELFYVVAVLNRTSLSALGPQTQEHFGILATALSSFAVLQLVMYAAMQIPVGLLLDRFGVTIVLLSGGTVMFLAQLVMAYTSEPVIAVIARMFLGAGDACIFISVMRLLPDWFEARQLPLMGQVTGIVGHLGQVLSLLPLAFAVSALGWSAAFTGVAGAGLLVVLLGVLVLRDSPGKRTFFERMRKKSGSLTERSKRLLETKSIGFSAMPATTMAINTIVMNTGDGVFSRIKTLLKIPGVRLAFWVHFTLPMSSNVILLLWGTPFLIGAVGLTPVQASSFLTSVVLVSITAGLLFGKLTARYATKRVHIVLAVQYVMIALWAMTLLWPGRPPVAAAIFAIIFSVAGGPASMVSFEVVRSYSPRRMSGVATGMVNMGGFIAGLAAMFAVGLMLDILGAGTPETYSPAAFRAAFSVFFVIWALGIWRILAEMRNTRGWIATHQAR